MRPSCARPLVMIKYLYYYNWTKCSMVIQIHTSCSTLQCSSLLLFVIFTVLVSFMPRVTDKIEVWTLVFLLVMPLPIQGSCP